MMPISRKLSWLLSLLKTLHDIFGKILLDDIEVYLRFEAKLLEGIDIDSFIFDITGVGAKGEAAEGFIEEGSFHDIDLRKI